jgi:DNA-directed RNA polymerase subunit N (RpoN/RPB10)
MAQIPIVQHFCTCTDEDYNPTLLGWKQKEYEKYMNEGMTIFDTLNKMGVKRLCCREKLFNPPMLFLNNADIVRLRDDTVLLTK